MALAISPRVIPLGSAAPRVAPPLPLTTWQPEYVAIAKEIGRELWPWQRDYAAKYLMARDGDRWRFREVCIVVARQNGKTELLVPRIIMDLRAGRRILHTAHRMRLARKVFLRVARVLRDEAEIRFAQGQEEIALPNGGTYGTIAAQRGARGESADTLIIDEVREFEDFDVVGAAMPTLTASPDPQVIYLSNAGYDKSVVLNQLRDSAQSGEGLAYIEWSADPELDAGDIEGWAQANPALGYAPGMYDNLLHAFTNRPSALFETEHLCRWVATLNPALVTDIAWRSCHTDSLGKPFRPYLGVALDPSGKRASAALAWKVDDGTIAYRPLLEVDDPLVDDFGEQVRAEALHHRVRGSAYSALSDTAIARYLTKPTPVDGRLYSNASANFAALVETRKLRWSEAEPATDDLRYTIRKDHAEGAWSAVRSEDSRPITAVLAAVRAVWLASAPRPPAPRIG